jgi:aspartyl-tRNA(Asn)/glutamyl-tRNA(Gln) amidotransferase subunit C
VPPTSHVLSQTPANRPDQSRPGLTTEEALANAPDPSTQNTLFRVPRVLG